MKSKFTLIQLLIVCAMLALLAALCMPQIVKADTQVSIYQPMTTASATNQPAVVTTGASSNCVSIVNVPQKTGLSYAQKFNVSSGTSNVVVQFTPSQDGTNYDGDPWQLVRNATGTTDKTITTNWPPGVLSGYKTLKVSALTNQNAGTLTNKGGQWAFPNP